MMLIIWKILEIVLILKSKIWVLGENKEQNNLLKDLIKILTIKELQSKQNVKRFPYTYGNFPYSFQNSPYIAN